MDDIAIIGFYGPSNSGKTKLITKIIKSLDEEGFHVANIKKSDKIIDIDSEGKDTWKYKKSGSKLVVLSSIKNTDFMLENRLEIEEIVNIISKIDRFDVVLIEGSNDVNIPKVKVGDGISRDNTIIDYRDNFNDVLSLIKNMIRNNENN